MNNIKCELRRVIQDYFGYNIFYVMNITDIDDKARRSKNIIMITFCYELPMPYFFYHTSKRSVFLDICLLPFYRLNNSSVSPQRLKSAPKQNHLGE